MKKDSISIEDIGDLLDWRNLHNVEVAGHIVSLTPLLSPMDALNALLLVEIQFAAILRAHWGFTLPVRLPAGYRDSIVDAHDRLSRAITYYCTNILDVGA